MNLNPHAFLSCGKQILSLLIIFCISCKSEEIPIPKVEIIEDKKVPILQTFEVSDITLYSVKAGGRLVNPGNSLVTEQGLVAGLNPGATISDNLAKFSLAKDDSGRFSVTIHQFPASTKFYVRSYAINAEGVGYGNEVNFTSPAENVYKENAGWITLSTQEQVIEFGSHKYTTIQTLTITGTVTDLTPLNALVIVTGAVTIEKTTALKNLSGLENLRVTGYFFPNGVWIEHNLELESLLGLNNLEIIGGHLQLVNNDKLTTMKGLDGLIAASVGGLGIYDCDELKNLSGLEKLSFIGNDFSLVNNPHLDDISALSNLTKIWGRIVVNKMPLLPNVHGLEGIKSVEAVHIEKNDALQNLNGLKNVESCKVSIWLMFNPYLSDLSGLQHIDSVEYLNISANNSLESLNGLENLRVVKFLEVQNNNVLSNFCALKPLLLKQKTSTTIAFNLMNPTVNEIVTNCE